MNEQRPNKSKELSYNATYVSRACVCPIVAYPLIYMHFRAIITLSESSFIVTAFVRLSKEIKFRCNLIFATSFSLT